MRSAITFHSKSTKKYAEKIAGNYSPSAIFEITNPPTKDVFNYPPILGCEVLAVGGGSVIDTAKIIYKDRRITAIPTTAAGASMTPYATVWLKDKKISVPTKKPFLRHFEGEIQLPWKVLRSTLFDCLSHAIESFWSVDATPESKSLSIWAIEMIKEYLDGDGDINVLIKAGNIAGSAIAITRTNIVHKASYPLTIEHGIDHGTAVGILLPLVVLSYRDTDLPKLFGFETSKQLTVYLLNLYYHKYPNFIRQFNK